MAELLAVVGLIAVLAGAVAADRWAERRWADRWRGEYPDDGDDPPRIPPWF